MSVISAQRYLGGLLGQASHGLRVTNLAGVAIALAVAERAHCFGWYVAFAAVPDIVPRKMLVHRPDRALSIQTSKECTGVLSMQILVVWGVAKRAHRRASHRSAVLFLYVYRQAHVVCLASLAAAPRK